MKFRLVSKHYIHDRMLDEGTIVGDDTPFPIPEGGVTPEMEGLDDESREEIHRVKEAQSKPFQSAAPLGMVYLEPQVQDALIDLARAQKSQLPGGGQQHRSYDEPHRTGQPNKEETERKSVATSFSPKPPPDVPKSPSEKK